MARSVCGERTLILLATVYGWNYVDRVTIEVPDQDLGSLKLSSAEARLDLAIGLYTGRRASMGKAAKVAGVSYPAFLAELGRRGICINYSVEDFEHDLRTLEVAEQKSRE
jgi:predicted HTH domain antitoxin